jgi:hypothetical protein
MPYALAVLFLVFFAGRAQLPAALAQPFFAGRARRRRDERAGGEGTRLQQKERRS